MNAFCQDCLETIPAQTKRCGRCGSTRILSHPELEELQLAHIDCDAFYASIEKRDDPSIRQKAVIIGGGKRGVVATCCYIARINGVHSAMPMYRALKACPDAHVIRPNMKKYRRVGEKIRQMMQKLTPLVEPISIDEAFLDLSGTRRLHKKSAAKSLAKLAGDIEREIGITVSVGLSYNKFLAKVASDLNKPRGFSIIGRAEALTFLAGQDVSLIWGVGKKLREKLRRDGLVKISQLQAMSEQELVRCYGAIGSRLARFSRGKDPRRITTRQPAKSISSEITFDRDIADRRALEKRLWPLCEAVSEDLKLKGLAGRTLTLKLKPNIHRSLTRSITLNTPTQMAHEIFDHARVLLLKVADGKPFRLIGIGASSLESAHAVYMGDLLDPSRERKDAAEKAMDELKDRFGKSAVKKGRSLK